MTKPDHKTRNFLFTINNYTKEDLTQLHTIGSLLDRHRYLCFGLEIAPETGTKHIQGYIQFKEAQRYTFLQNYFNLQRDGEMLRFHIEPANGTPQQNIDYCSKDGDFYHYGEPLSQGARTDLIAIKQEVSENPRNIKRIVEEYGNNYQQVRYAETLLPYYFKPRDLNYPPCVLWIFGPSGIGKTKVVYDNFTDVCSVSSYAWLGTDYLQNTCLLLDDFRMHDLEFHTLLKLTDRYPFTLEYKGGQIPLNSPYIIITSPNSIEATFASSTESLFQLQRRITQVNLGLVEDISSLNLKNIDEEYIHRPVNDKNDVW